MLQKNNTNLLLLFASLLLISTIFYKIYYQKRKNKEERNGNYSKIGKFRLGRVGLPNVTEVDQPVIYLFEGLLHNNTTKSLQFRVAKGLFMARMR
jgi:hypothetical protein